MRILFLSNRFWPYLGGAERLAAKLVADLGKAEHAFAVITSHAELDLPDQEYYRETPIYRFEFQQSLSEGVPSKVIKLRRDLEKAIDAFDPDLIHLYAVGPPLFFLNPLLRKSQAPMVMTLHSELLPSQIGSANTALSDSLSMADWVTACSESALAAARELVPAICSRSSVVRNAFDLGTFLPGPPPTAPMRLLCLGRLVPVKGFDTAVSALRVLHGRFPQTRLQIAGEGPERGRLEQLVDDYGLRDVVDFLGQVPPDQVPRVIDRASIVLMPSTTEGLPIAAIEAALVGRPIVATRVGGNSEIVEHGETGLLTALGSVEELIMATASLLESPERVLRMGAAARRRARTEFGWSAYLDAYRELYGRYRHDLRVQEGDRH